MALGPILMQIILQAYNVSSLGINVWAFQVANGLSSTTLTAIMSALSGSFLVVIPLVALYLYFKKDMDAFSFIVAAVLLYVVADIIKFIVMEPRPCSIVGEITWIPSNLCETSFSFPSAHATVLSGLTLFLRKYNYLRILYLVWLLLILFGRVYLGEHYLTDVIAGVLISIAVSYALLRYKDRINGVVNNIVKKIIPSAAIK
jgi:undecaprenyl-diphosphatase